MGNAVAQDITVLSAGAVEPGLRAALALYDKKTTITFNTAPQVRERIEKKGEKFDVVIVPPAVMDAFAEAGRVEADRVLLGRVGQGIAVRPGAPVPDVSSVEALKRAMLEAESVVFNRAYRRAVHRKHAAQDRRVRPDRKQDHALCQRGGGDEPPAEGQGPRGGLRADDRDHALQGQGPALRRPAAGRSAAAQRLRRLAYARRCERSGGCGAGEISRHASPRKRPLPPAASSS